MESAITYLKMESFLEFIKTQKSFNICITTILVMFLLFIITFKLPRNLSNFINFFILIISGSIVFLQIYLVLNMENACFLLVPYFNFPFDSSLLALYSIILCGFSVIKLMPEVDPKDIVYTGRTPFPHIIFF